ncbi:MAG: FIST C-terminal domain-containing protein, partial [Polyangiaceae bacterium]|nr:FIST C-terminal domain-containing protein [Polyangiaceae bacterium]
MTSALHYCETVAAPATRETVAAWRTEHREMGLLALVAEADRALEVPALQELCHDLQVPLVGAVFPAVLFQSRFRTRGSVLVRLDRMPFAALYHPLNAADPASHEVRARMIADLAGRLGRTRGSALFLVVDQMVANVATLLDDLYLTLADRVRYLGANAGSETFQPMPCLFDGAQVAQDGAIAMLLEAHPGAAVEHCYRVPERLVSATSTEGNRIIAIDWRPAFEAYQQAVQAEYGVAINRENFYAYAVHFPFGIVRAGAEVVVRIPVSLQPDGSLFCVGEVPPNAVLALLHAPAVDSVRTVNTLVATLRSLSGDLAG